VYFSGDGRKLYIVHDGVEIYYVGETIGSIKKRFDRAVRAFKNHQAGKKNKNGYSGYKWLRESTVTDLKLYVIEFDQEYDHNRLFIEAIEAEFVYLVRKASKWPVYQHEIHFYRIPDMSAIAQEIFTEFEKQLNK
jgi:hypothetical protein